MISLVIWTSSRCNLKCRYCYAAAAKPLDMECQTFEKALEAVGAEEFKLQLAGGEPLMNMPLVARILERVSRMANFRGAAIQTNGTLIDEDVARLLKRYRVATGVSLDGGPGTNEYQRGGTKAAIEGIQNLRRHGIAVNLNCTVTAYNAQRLHETADIAMYLGNVRGIGLDLLRMAGRAATGSGACAQPPDADALISGLDALLERITALNRMLPPERGLVLREMENAKRQLASRCGGGYCYAALGKSYTVLPDGECYPCGSLAGDSRYRMGNVHDMIRPLSIRAEDDGECGGCPYRDVCTGRCPSRALLNGGFTKSDCLMKQYIFSKLEVNTNEKRKTSLTVDGCYYDGVTAGGMPDRQ